MTIDTEVLIAMTGGLSLLLGLLVAWLVIGRMAASNDRAKESALDAVEAERNDLEKRLALSEQRNETIEELRKEMAQRRAQAESLQEELRELSSALSREKERASHAESLSEKLADSERKVERLKDLLAQRESEQRELSARMEEERKNMDEKLALLETAKKELSNQFQVLAQEILEEKGKVFSEQSQSRLKTLLDPFREQLSEFKQKVETVYVDEARERASLKKEIETLRTLNQQISQEAVNLTRALKGDKKAQGTWGELILERVLEQSGLRRGIEYEAQGGFRDADGRLLKPDVIVHLPEEKDVVIDSKVSLIAYERYSTAEAEEEKSTSLAEHVKAVKAHIDRLSGKDYGALKGLRSLDFVLLFMPIEAAFLAAFKADDNLFSYAFEKRIVVVTPTTLLATLKTIENIWRYERQNKSAQEIVRRAGAIYDKLRLFVESMEKLGKQIDTVQGTYDEAMNRLVRGRGNVISQASRFPELGVSVKTAIPRTVTEIAEDEVTDLEEDGEEPEA
ncbi:MAG: DNA recombination protein RmuC [Desulfobacterales bacterium]|jgi:DNA recombination protein RmuC